MTLFKFEVINFLFERVEKSSHHLRVDNNSHRETHLKHTIPHPPQGIKDILHMGGDATGNVQVMLLDQ